MKEAQTKRGVELVKAGMGKGQGERDEESHPIERLLSNPLIRWLLRLLTRKDRDGRCAFENIILSYGRDGLSLGRRIKYWLPFALIDLIGKNGGADREAVRDKVFNYRPRVRALVNTAHSIALYGLTKPQSFSAPLMVVWNFTQVCNLRCKHCYQNASTPLPDELTLEEQLDIVDQMGYNDVAMLAFSGGEPLISKNFWPVAKRTAEHGIHVVVATNGTLITPEVAEKMVDHGVKYVEVSLDSVHPEKHNAFRGANVWKRTVEGIKNVVVQEGLKAGIAPCLTRLNYDELEDMIRFCRDLGVDTLNVFNFIPTGRGKEMVDLDLTPQMREEALKILWREMRTRGLTIMSTFPQLGRACLMFSADDGPIATGHVGVGAGKEAQVYAKYIGGCGAGRCYAAIQPNGLVTPCVFMPIVIGDLRKEKFIDIWRRSEVCRILRDREDRTGHCRTCDYKYHCGGCRARAYGYTKDFTAADLGCIYNADEWEQLSQAAS